MLTYDITGYHLSSSRSSGNPYPFTNLPFYVIFHGYESYDMDMTWILQHQVSFGKCLIHVISMSYSIFKKNIFGYTWYILKKNAFGICQVYLFMSYAIPVHVLSMSLVCQVVLFRPTNEIQPEIALLFESCIPWNSVHQAQQDLFARATREDSSFAPGLWWGRCLP